MGYFMTFEHAIEKINQQRFQLRADLLNKMRTNPTLKDSETLRLVENDISFWEQQTDYSVNGLITSLEKSLALH